MEDRQSGKKERKQHYGARMPRTKEGRLKQWIGFLMQIGFHFRIILLTSLMPGQPEPRVDDFLIGM
jgi:hypothetical protein